MNFPLSVPLPTGFNPSIFFEGAALLGLSRQPEERPKHQARPNHGKLARRAMRTKPDLAVSPRSHPPQMKRAAGRRFR